MLPILEDGRFCASDMVGGRRQLRELQDSYGKAMAKFGLKRGVYGSKTRHRDPRGFYARLNKAVDIPEVVQGESAEEYRTRVIEQIHETLASIHLKESQIEVRIRQKQDEERYCRIQESRKLQDEKSKTGKTSTESDSNIFVAEDTQEIH